MPKVKKVRTRGFTQVDNRVISDKRMSLKALGLFTYMWSKPDDWEFYVLAISKDFKDGRDSIRSAINELINLGYVKRTRKHKENGQLAAYDYILFDEPKTEKPSQAVTYDGKTYVGKTYVGKSATTNTYCTNTNLTNDWLIDNKLSSLPEKLGETERQWGMLSTKTKGSLEGLARQFGPQVVGEGLQAFNENGQYKSGLIKYIKKYIESQKAGPEPLKLSASLVKLERRKI
ncbi:helix-turn-helix domain-containing protein [Limosilactobacillus fermentum]|uniref:helix-turn-helix domain-containing protein n=1 Tax=Limosilactobacillus fermentum TaxID=1613 RepID=UPI00187DE873|nr:helix-turn-helix domain-containing protein [Limosilactobacillus fermentum]MBE8118761.1 helix-turn-helix domain-containing protein [Limosilactobacillus fermentum]